MIPFSIGLDPPRGTDWGYRFRSGRRSHYNYWYFNDRENKYYSGHKPSSYLIKIKEKRINGPRFRDRCDIPWENYFKSNPEIIETKAIPIALMNYFGITDTDELDLHEDFAYLSVINNILHNFSVDDPITLPFIL